MTIEEKLTILTDAAKYDVACTSSGADRSGGRLGKTMAAGCCHSFSADGRCVTLLKVLLTNVCCYDCQYCVNRTSNDLPRAMFTPRELAELTIDFYRRNYIEGLFLSSAVVRNPDYTTELMIKALSILRRSTSFPATSTPRPSPERTPCSPPGWGSWRTGCPSTSSCPPPKALPCWPRTRRRTTSSAPWLRFSQEFWRPRRTGKSSATPRPLPPPASPPR